MGVEAADARHAGSRRQCQNSPPIAPLYPPASMCGIVGYVGERTWTALPIEDSEIATITPEGVRLADALSGAPIDRRREKPLRSDVLSESSPPSPAAPPPTPPAP